MAKSEITKKYSKLGLIFTILSALLLIGPMLYYIILGFMSATVVVEKVALTATIAMSLILTLICAVNKIVFRSKIWLLVLALFFVIDHFLVMILVFGITQCVDEIIVSPLAKYFRNKASINKEIDKRLP